MAVSKFKWCSQGHLKASAIGAEAKAIKFRLEDYSLHYRKIREFMIIINIYKLPINKLEMYIVIDVLN